MALAKKKTAPSKKTAPAKTLGVKAAKKEVTKKEVVKKVSPVQKEAPKVAKKAAKSVPVKTVPAILAKPAKTVAVKKPSIEVPVHHKKPQKPFVDLSLEGVLAMCIWTLFTFIMAYDFYLVDTQTHTASETLLNFVIHFFIFGVIFCAIHYILNSKK